MNGLFLALPSEATDTVVTVVLLAVPGPAL